ncbi:MAG: cell division protein FtsL, partial [Salinisphaera sp.]|nr:cell division protein FtsL [Salinisphaera sp.]
AHELQLERVERDKLSTEWAQLQLEESAWANPDRVAQVVRRELSMVQPRNYVVLESQR